MIKPYWSTECIRSLNSQSPLVLRKANKYSSISLWLLVRAAQSHAGKDHRKTVPMLMWHLSQTVHVGGIVLRVRMSTVWLSCKIYKLNVYRRSQDLTCSLFHTSSQIHVRSYVEHGLCRVRSIHYLKRFLQNKIRGKDCRTDVIRCKTLLRADCNGSAVRHGVHSVLWSH